MASLELNIFSWNATGIMSSAMYLCEVLNHKSVDFCGISEHWLFEKNLHFLSELDRNYNSHGVCDSDLKLPSQRRVGKGGVAILWHKKHENNVYPLNIDDDRIVGIKYEINTMCSIYLIQVYLPCSNHSIENFRDYFDRLQNIIHYYSEKGLVILMGDMNTYLPWLSTRVRPSGRSVCFQSFLQRNNLISVNTLGMCTGAKSTFVTYDGRHESLIDHFIIPVEKAHFVKSCEICDDHALNVSRHRPIFCTLSIPAFVNEYEYAWTGEYGISWKKVTNELISHYQSFLRTDEVLAFIKENEISSQVSIDQTYNNLVNVIKAKAENCFPKKRFKACLKPYWNSELGNLHKQMRQKRRAWLNDGKPRNPSYISYTQYKAAKRDFRRIHRKHVELYLKRQTDEIDHLAEVDSGLFWRLVNSRRQKSYCSPGTELIFNNQKFDSSTEITEQWANYFETLYTPRDSPHYDGNFRISIERETSQILGNDNLTENFMGNDGMVISSEEVESAVRLAKMGKAGGEDGITYEHILYGGPFLYEILAKFYNAIIRESYTPKEMKKGVIVTLFKGGGKRKDNPDNYRAITLSSVLLKLLERVLLTRIQLFNEISPPIHPLQGGYRKNLGCLMTSFALKESTHFAKENSSKLYICFLDVKKAFDTVWHQGLYYKMYVSGIDMIIIKTVISMYSEMTSCVKGQSSKSHWFPVLQGTRQGGVLSPFLYLLYINELLWILEKSDLGFCFRNINCSNLTVADDMLIASFSKVGLDKMINLCYEYACKWRFQYQASKCSVIVFNESKNSYENSMRVWKLGTEDILESYLYKHLGIWCEKYSSLDDCVKDACNKIKGALISLINCGLCEDGLNPITLKHIYKAAVLPKALYGSELWNNLLPKHLILLEKAHRFCIKLIQSLPRRTSTDFALSLLNMRSIESEVDYRKLIFFGQLCRLPGEYRIKQIFLNRLMQFYSSVQSSQGFFPDIYRILGKYSLINVLETFIKSGFFPTKFSWKRLVNDKMRLKHERDWGLRVETSPILRRILRIHVSNKEFVFWEFSKKFPKLSPFVFKAVRMLGFMFSAKYLQTCYLCQNAVFSLMEHLLLFCKYTQEFRNLLWEKLMNRFGLDFYLAFIAYSPVDQVDLLFSGCQGILSSETDTFDCIRIFVLSLLHIHLLNNSGTII